MFNILFYIIILSVSFYTLTTVLNQNILFPTNTYRQTSCNIYYDNVLHVLWTKSHDLTSQETLFTKNTIRQSVPYYTTQSSQMNTVRQSVVRYMLQANFVSTLQKPIQLTNQDNVTSHSSQFVTCCILMCICEYIVDTEQKKKGKKLRLLLMMITMMMKNYYY